MRSDLQTGFELIFSREMIRSWLETQLLIIDDEWFDLMIDWICFSQHPLAGLYLSVALIEHRCGRTALSLLIHFFEISRSFGSIFGLSLVQFSCTVPIVWGCFDAGDRSYSRWSAQVPPKRRAFPIGTSHMILKFCEILRIKINHFIPTNGAVWAPADFASCHHLLRCAPSIIIITNAITW